MVETKLFNKIIGIIIDDDSNLNKTLILIVDDYIVNNRVKKRYIFNNMLFSGSLYLIICYSK